MLKKLNMSCFYGFLGLRVIYDFSLFVRSIRRVHGDERCFASMFEKRYTSLLPKGHQGTIGVVLKMLNTFQTYIQELFRPVKSFTIRMNNGFSLCPRTSSDSRAHASPGNVCGRRRHPNAQKCNRPRWVSEQQVPKYET